MRTLYLRVRAACASAQRIAEHFDGHPHGRRGAVPGPAGLPGHDGRAARRCRAASAACCRCACAGGEAAAIAVAAHTQLWKRATSLGGIESLIEHRASVEGAGTPAPPDLLRLSVGIEHVDDLIADLEQALALAHAAGDPPSGATPGFDLDVKPRHHRACNLITCPVCGSSPCPSISFSSVAPAT